MLASLRVTVAQSAVTGMHRDYLGCLHVLSVRLSTGLSVILVFYAVNPPVSPIFYMRKVEQAGKQWRSQTFESGGGDIDSDAEGV